MLCNISVVCVTTWKQNGAVANLVLVKIKDRFVTASTSRRLLNVKVISMFLWASL